MSLSSSLERFLAQMEYPATKDDLLREAVRDGLGRDDVMALDQLDGFSYSARWQIICALRAVGASERDLVAA